MRAHLAGPVGGRRCVSADPGGASLDALVGEHPEAALCADNFSRSTLFPVHLSSTPTRRCSSASSSRTRLMPSIRSGTCPVPRPPARPPRFAASWNILGVCGGLFIPGNQATLCVTWSLRRLTERPGCHISARHPHRCEMQTPWLHRITALLPRVLSGDGRPTRSAPAGSNSGPP